MLSVASLLNPTDPKSPQLKPATPPSAISLTQNGVITVPLMTPVAEHIINRPLSSPPGSAFLSSGTRPTSAHAQFQAPPTRQHPGYSPHQSQSTPYALSTSYPHAGPLMSYQPGPQTTPSRLYMGDPRSMPSSIPVHVYHSPALSPSGPMSKPRAYGGVTSRENSAFAKSPINGPVNYPPFENLDEHMVDYVRAFNVKPLGRIHENSSHIPYNSGKKDFFEKTGRESFEVFSYTFSKDEVEFNVMWDYNNGLVRMTPFFKCCGYGKTVPAKMLNMNPGLKEITHSITGGTILAQGYWMPYECARAVCATFCHNIAGALVPIFGPQFVQECFHPDSKNYKNMAINSLIIRKAAHEAELFRRQYATIATARRRSPATGSLSPKRSRRMNRMTPESPYFSRAAESPYTTDNEEECLPSPVGGYPPTVAYPPYNHPAPTSTGWTAINTAPPHGRNNNNTRQPRDSSMAFSREASCETAPHLTALPSLKPSQSVSPPMPPSCTSAAAAGFPTPSPISPSMPLSFPPRQSQAYACAALPLPRPVTGKRRMEIEHNASLVRYDRSYRSASSDLSAYKYSRSQPYTSTSASTPALPMPIRQGPTSAPSSCAQPGPGHTPTAASATSATVMAADVSENKNAAILLMGLSVQEQEAAAKTAESKIVAVAQQTMGCLSAADGRRMSL